jgi:hypothetical protein
MSDFFALAQQAEADPSTADFAALRQAYVASPAYRPFKHILHSKLRQITDSAQNLDEVLKICRDLLTANPLDLEARMMLAFLLEKSGQTAAAEREHVFAERLLDAILATGDGKSFEKAIQVVAEAEMWTVMRAFGIQAEGQERHQREGRVYDVFTGAIDGRAVTIYFDATLPAQHFDTDIVGA